MSITFKEIVLSVQDKFLGKDKLPSPFNINRVLNECLRGLSISNPYLVQITYTGKTTDNFALTTSALALTGNRVMKVNSVTLNDNPVVLSMTYEEYERGAWENDYICLAVNKQDDIYIQFPINLEATDTVVIWAEIGYSELTDALTTASINIHPAWYNYLVYYISKELAMVQEYYDTNLFMILEARCNAERSKVSGLINNPLPQRFRGWATL